MTLCRFDQRAVDEKLIGRELAAAFADRDQLRVGPGHRQRVRALNAFLHDIYHDQEIIKAGRIPARQVLGVCRT